MFCVEAWIQVILFLLFSTFGIVVLTEQFLLFWGNQSEIERENISLGWGLNPEYLILTLLFPFSGIVVLIKNYRLDGIKTDRKNFSLLWCSNPDNFISLLSYFVKCWNLDSVETCLYLKYKQVKLNFKRYFDYKSDGCGSFTHRL